MSQYWLTRFCFQRLLGFIYFIAFLVVVYQFRPLLGEHGLLPAKLFLRKLSFWNAPSLFWFNSSDSFVSVMGWAGVFLSLAAMTGLSDAFGILVSVVVWTFLWFLYLSFVNIGQIFYSFGWETMLLETGFLAIFLGSSNTPSPKIVIWLLRWVLFRVMFGAGLIKLRGDECWRNLTCLVYHYETQPLPNPLSWYFHKFPLPIHKAGVLLTYFAELIAPWGVLGPRLLSYSAGLVMIVFQITLILSGNLSWLNYLTLALCIPCLDDRFLSHFIPFKPPTLEPIGTVHQGIVIALAALIVFLSLRPTLNLISPQQIMNTSFEPFHLVNTYGAFGSVTRQRTEIIVEGTEDPSIGEWTKWREYEFKAKPGNTMRRPAVAAPYHDRLDWLMWFAAMSDYRYHPWFLNLVAKLLKGDRDVLSLMGPNPFPETPPKYIRALLYEYHFTHFEDKRKTGRWWARTLVGEYLRPLSSNDSTLQESLREQGWL